MTLQFDRSEPGAEPETNGSRVAVAKPLAAIVTTSSLEQVYPGQVHEVGVTVSNLGEQSAIISVYINEQTSALRQWCALLEQRLALGPGQSGEVFFRFAIATDAVAGLYEYDLIIDAPEHYANVPSLRYSHRQIQVLPPERNATAEQDPVFGLETITAPDAPIKLQPGQPVLVQAFVENRTERVDRYRLTCSGLPTGWSAKVQYPAGLAGVGLVTEADSLGLNPGERRQLPIVIQSPPKAIAGSYMPTLRLQSENQPQLGLFDLLYLQIEPIYLLQPQLQVQQNQVNESPAQFAIQILNSGNTERHLNLTIQSNDSPECCTYRLATDTLHLQPQCVAQVLLQAQPKPTWRRPWFGSGRLYNFQVLLDDPEQLPLATKALPGYFTWTARPWWQLVLAILLTVGTAAGIAGLIWWLFLRSPAPSAVQDFAAEDAQYSEAADEAARVGWTINNPQQLRSLQLTGLSPDGEVLSGPLSYEFSAQDLKQGILPKSLQPHCQLTSAQLACRNVQTDARRPGQYIFELKVQQASRGKSRQPVTLQTKPVTVLARPQPQVTAFLSAALNYQEVGSPFEDPDAAPLPSDGIGLHWTVSQPEDLQALKLAVRTAEGDLVGSLTFPMEFVDGELMPPQKLAPYCVIQEDLICQSVPTGIVALGRYQFELTPLLYSDLAPALVDGPTVNPSSTASSEAGLSSAQLGTVQTEIVTIQPQPSLIEDLVVDCRFAQAETISGCRFPVPRGMLAPVVPLAWSVIGGASTRVELLPSPGSVPLQGEIGLPLPQQYGTATVTLRVTDDTGEVETRSISIETYDPNPVDPAEVAAIAAMEAALVASQTNQAALQALQQQQAFQQEVQALQQQVQLEQQQAFQQQLLQQTQMSNESSAVPDSVQPTPGGAALLKPGQPVNLETFTPAPVPTDPSILSPAESSPQFK